MKIERTRYVIMRRNRTEIAAIEEALGFKL